MSYCLVGESSKVTFKFGKGQKQIFESKVSPVEVIGQNLDTKNSYSYRDPNSESVRNVVGTSYSTETLDYCLQGKTAIRVFDGSQEVIYSCFLNGSLKTVLIRECKLEIFYRSNVIFSITGECPVIFNVACGDDCPADFCKCEIPEYPGYCCLDCGAIASQVRAITNFLRGKNG